MKIAILPKLSYGFNAIPIKKIQGHSSQKGKHNLKIQYISKKDWLARTCLNRKNTVRGIRTSGPTTEPENKPAARHWPKSKLLGNNKGKGEGKRGRKEGRRREGREEGIKRGREEEEGKEGGKEGREGREKKEMGRNEQQMLWKVLACSETQSVTKIRPETAWPET